MFPRDRVIVSLQKYRIAFAESDETSLQSGATRREPIRWSLWIWLKARFEIFVFHLKIGSLRTALAAT